jgi:SAM-dependent methyltransferase
MSLLDKVHGGYVHNRRVQVLRDEIAKLLPQKASVLDIGCGDGLLDSLILKERPDVSIQGLDVLVREDTHIPVTHFDGHTIPFPDNSFDVVLFVDVLHHTDDPLILLREAARVSRKYVLLKDHTRNGLLARPTLRFMDWVGNARHGVVLPYNYLSQAEWEKAFSAVGLRVETWTKDIPLYPFPANLVFGRSLHMVGRMEK